MTKEIECKLPCIKHHHGKDEKQTVFGYGPTREKALAEAREIAHRYGMKPNGEVPVTYSDDDVSTQPVAAQQPDNAGGTELGKILTKLSADSQGTVTGSIDQRAVFLFLPNPGRYDTLTVDGCHTADELIEMGMWLKHMQGIKETT